MYVIFRVSPFHKNVARSILKAPKFYFYDTGQVVGDKGIKLENLVAEALLKEIHFREDCLGERCELYFLRTKDGRKIDFLVTKDSLPLLMLEVKWGDGKPSRNFEIFSSFFPNTKKIQLVKDLDREKTYPDGTEIRSACNWLTDFSL